MEVFKDVTSLQSYLKNIGKSQTIGFVPTMGALHEGHLSIVEKALKENDIVVVSIYVNPTQFNNKTDLRKYPKNIRKDLSYLKNYGCHAVFTPTTEEIYNDTVAATSFNFNGLATVMEGKYRPGHFDGVATVVKKLFEIVKPHNAYFGEKDYQQIRIIQQLVKQEKIAVNIIPCPIVREPSGLAMSSRNKRLDETQLREAANIFQTLIGVRLNYKSMPIADLKEAVSKYFSKQKHLSLEYFEIADIDTLKPASKIEKGKKYRAFIAAYADKVRLIDNIDLA